MQAETYVKAKVAPEIKEYATAVLDRMGLSMTEAIKLYLLSIIREEKLPFEICAVDLPNETTKRAMMAADRGELTRVNSLEEILE